MTPLNVTTLKMILAVVGTVIFLALFSATTQHQHQQISLTNCPSVTHSHAVNVATTSCSSANSTLLGKNG